MTPKGHSLVDQRASGPLILILSNLDKKILIVSNFRFTFKQPNTTCLEINIIFIINFKLHNK